MMTLSEELLWRGQIKDMTCKSVKWLDSRRTFYLGADCSSDSLTIGNLAIFMMARRLRKHGWNAVLLVGGATSMIGDPGGKESERQLKSHEEIEKNVAGIKVQVERLFSGMEFTLVDNYDWFKDISYLDFLRDVGKHFSMTELLQRDYIAQRLGPDSEGISYAEFSYSLIQGYDYWHLYKEHHVELQIGGSDQWGNMLSGVPLIRKKEDAEVHAISMPLIINKSTGKKFGKSEDGAIWLDAARTTPTQFYQFWINVDDHAVEDYLKIYTEYDKDTIDRIVEGHAANRSDRQAQKHLARAVTELVHGTDAMMFAEVVTDYLTGLASIGDASDDILAEIKQQIPSIEVSVNNSIADALQKAGLAASLTEARRLLQNNAIAINGQKIARDNFVPEDFIAGRLMLKKGKKFKDTALVEQA